MAGLPLEGRIVLVTGGGSGIGLASTKSFASGGAVVLIADRNGEAADAVAESICCAGGRAKAYEVDVSSVAQLRALFVAIESEFGRLNTLFSHAGVQGGIGFEVNEEEFDRIVAVNLKSHYFATRFALPLLRKCAPHASIIYTASTSGLRAGSHSPLYSATKAAILMLMRSAAKQLGPDQIRANAICPGPVETPFSREFARIARQSHSLSDTAHNEVLRSSSQSIPLGRVAQPNDVIGLVQFLASDQSIYLTGAAIPIDGGLTA